MDGKRRALGKRLLCYKKVIMFVAKLCCTVFVVVACFVHAFIFNLKQTAARAVQCSDGCLRQAHSCLVYFCNFFLARLCGAELCFCDTGSMLTVKMHA